MQDLDSCFTSAEKVLEVPDLIGLPYLEWDSRKKKGHFECAYFWMKKIYGKIIEVFHSLCNSRIEPLFIVASLICNVTRAELVL